MFQFSDLQYMGEKTHKSWGEETIEFYGWIFKKKNTKYFVFFGFDYGSLIKGGITVR